MISLLKRFFKKEEKPTKKQEEDFTSELYQRYYDEDLANVKNSSKPILLIIDDNDGIISFIIDDLKEIEKRYGIDIFNTHKVVCMSGKDAGLRFFVTNKIEKIKIDKAIIDLTYGAVLKTQFNGNIKINGVDVFEDIYKNNKNVKFLFYTGNALNRYIKTIAELADKFKKITGKEIDEFAVKKNEYSSKEREDIFYKILFKE